MNTREATCSFRRQPKASGGNEMRAVCDDEATAREDSTIPAQKQRLRKQPLFFHTF